MVSVWFAFPFFSSLNSPEPQQTPKYTLNRTTQLLHVELSVGWLWKNTVLKRELDVGVHLVAAVLTRVHFALDFF